MPKLIVQANNIHNGGGKSLLLAFLQVSLDHYSVDVLVDSRMSLPKDISPKFHIRKIHPSVVHRLLSEKWIVNHVASGDVVLCFGNLPPIFRLGVYTVVFVQNRYVIDDVKLTGFSLKSKLRLYLERWWFANKFLNADEFIVQTPSMQRLLETRIKEKTPVHLLPFISTPENYCRKFDFSEIKKEKRFDFLYVSSGEPHKNHRTLIDAWCLMAKENLFPSLKLTLDRVIFADLCDWVSQKVLQFRLNVENLGCLSHTQVKLLYAHAGALIYPSIFESLGLPLIEARQAGIPVLASELDYVRDVLDPEQTFDPESALSIARAVKRFLLINEQPLPLMDAVGFMKHVLKSVE
ncbi:MAG: glycosyltransferase [Chlorobium sp.]